MRSRLLRKLGAVACALASAAPVWAQEFPNRALRIVASEAGGSGDFAARLIAQGLTRALGHSVIVENRGGSGAIAGGITAKAAPDGHTMLFYGSTIWVLPFLQDNLPFHPVRDFAPVTLVSTAPNVLAVHPSVAASSVKELIALAKARPGELNYSSGTTGAATHLAAELFKSMAGVNIVRVAYKGGAPAINDLLAGQVQLTFGTVGSVGPHVKAGKLRALAVTSREPSQLFPGYPTVAASGLPGYEAGSIYGIYVPIKTPDPIVGRLNQEITRLLNNAEVKQRLLNAGTEPIGSSPQQLGATMKAEMARMSKVIKDAGIRAE